ncbi:Hepatocyte growth factor receptor [Liparis tanakae]|uniref:Hepatocyte growth factor receptor n=1 Tax=Liparis tanakae TaxID=230148 RepID=A0A4Z2EU33_9TELE|nr:Hepatocyte growth factor receptor [Liparis tanakae]
MGVLGVVLTVYSGLVLVVVLVLVLGLVLVVVLVVGLVLVLVLVLGLVLVVVLVVGLVLVLVLVLGLVLVVVLVVGLVLVLVLVLVLGLVLVVVLVVGLVLVLVLVSSPDDCGPHEGIREGKEGEYRLQVTQFVQRLEYWHRELTATLVTSITVVTVHGRAVAYLGTADGRHIQVQGHMQVEGHVQVEGHIQVQGHMQVEGHVQVEGHIQVEGHMQVEGHIQVAPRSGPIRGSTVVTLCGSVFGFDKTESFRNSVVTVEVGGAPCRLSRQDHVNRWTEMQCSPVFSGNFTPSGHTVKVTSSGKVATMEGFTFVDPVIHDIFPTFGPKSGNTVLTVNGAFLDAGNKRELTIGNVACKVQRSQPVKLTVDSVERLAPTAFTYNQDPIINGIRPSRSFISGGCTVSAHGFFLQSGLQPQMVLTTDRFSWTPESGEREKTETFRGLGLLTSASRVSAASAFPQTSKSCAFYEELARPQGGGGLHGPLAVQTERGSSFQNKVPSSRENDSARHAEASGDTAVTVKITVS